MDNYQPPQIGKNIMNYRKQKKISLHELSERSGVSKSMLSQIEQEKTNPTVITVWKIARSLDLSVEELIETGQDSQIEVLRCQDAPLRYSDDQSCAIRIISPVHMTDNLELYQMLLKPAGQLYTPKPHSPRVEEFLTVIKGKFLVTSGSYSVTLNEGDTARYRADTEHCIKNLSDTEAEAFLVVMFPKQG